MKEEIHKKKLRDVDTGWAWVSLGATFMGNFLVCFVNYSAGIFHIALLEEFKQDNASTSVAGSVFTSLTCLAGPFVGMFINGTNCRISMIFGGSVLALGFSLGFFATNLNIILLTYGVIAGIGSGFCCVTPLVMVGYSFDKYRGIATGLVSAGGGCGMFLSGPLVQFFLDQYGLHGAFLIVGGVCCHTIVLGALMRPSQSEEEHKHERKLFQNDRAEKCLTVRSMVDPSIFKNKSFVFILVAAFLWHGAYSVILLHLPNFSVVQGSEKSDASLLILDIGLGSSLSRILSGLTAGTDGGLDPVLLKLGVLGITGMITLLFPLYSQFYWQQTIFAALFGIYSGGLIAFSVPICLELVGLSKLASALGLFYFSGGIGYIAGPIIAGLIIDKTGTYAYCFYFSGAFFITGSFLVLLSTLWRPKDVERKARTAEFSLTGSNYLAASGLFSGSMNIVFEARQRTMSRTNNFLLSNERSQKNLHLNGGGPETVPLNDNCKH